MIQIIEEHALNAWPADRHLLYDGWLLRFGQGYTKRANSVNPLYRGAQPLQIKIERCIKLYRDKNLPPIFRLTPLAYPSHLDQTLADQGFSKQSQTSVQTLALDPSQSQQTTDFHCWEHFSSEWEDHFVRLNGKLTQRAAHRTILQNILPQTCFAMLSRGQRVVACGLGVLEHNHVGLFDLVTAAGERQKGYGQTLVADIVGWAIEKGATTAYLQVETGNIPALNLYKKLGFREIYQYWYRVQAF